MINIWSRDTIITYTTVMLMVMKKHWVTHVKSRTSVATFLC